MLDFLATDAVRTTLTNIALLGSISVLPALAVAYASDRRASRRLGTDFFLGKLEAAELDRAVFLYSQVSHRIQEVRGLAGAPSGLIKGRSRQTLSPELGQELDELEAYASHLHSIIVRLRSTPLQRFQAWVQVTSSRSALGRGLLIYVCTLGLLTALSFVPGLAETLSELRLGAALLVWQPIDDRFLYANAGAAALVAIVTPVLYSMRRAQLYRHHEPQFLILKDFAEKEPDLLPKSERSDSPESAIAAERIDETAWFAVLGVSEMATVDDIKAAYKERVKQSHPDRVSAMSPAIRALAESEMKALNIAYEQGLSARGGSF